MRGWRRRSGPAKTTTHKEIWVSISEFRCGGVRALLAFYDYVMLIPMGHLFICAMVCMKKSILLGVQGVQVRWGDLRVDPFRNDARLGLDDDLHNMVYLSPSPCRILSICSCSCIRGWYSVVKFCSRVNYCLCIGTSIFRILATGFGRHFEWYGMSIAILNLIQCKCSG